MPRTNNKLQQIRDQQDAENNAKVLRAISVLLHNQQVPQELFERVADFVCEQSNKTDFSDAILTEILKSVPEDELRRSILTKTRQKGASA